MDSVVNRFFVLDQSDIPDEVRVELEAYRSDPAPSSPPNTRGVAGDIAIAVLGGLISAGVWDQLPLWAMWWSGVASPFRRASAEEVTSNVASLCVRVGLAARPSEVTVDQLIEAPRLGWSGRARIGEKLVSFRTDRRARIVMFDTVSSGAAAG